MELENIIKLLDAGYTKDEINALMNPAAPAEEPAEEPAEPAEDPAPEPAQAADPAPAPAPQPAGNDQILEALNKLTNAIITKNLNATTAETAKEQTTTDILAKIIAPPRKEK